MNHSIRRPAAVSIALMSCAVAAAAHNDWRPRQLDAARGLAAARPQGFPGLPQVPAPTGRLMMTPGEQIEFPEISLDLESRDRARRRMVRSRGGSGVMDADRVAAGTITDIVLHSSLGQERNPRMGADSCRGTVNHLARESTAAHFMVCRDGRVFQMAYIDDVANHVKDIDFNMKSVGIETDTGYIGGTPYSPGDWDPDTRWRQTRSLAKLIRMLHEMTSRRIALTPEHIRTHASVDRAYCARARNECRPHMDPGPYFIGPRADAVKMFGSPSTRTTPWANLMRLVGDRSAPTTTFVFGSRPDQLSVIDDTGLFEVVVWKLTVPRSSLAPGAPIDRAARRIMTWTAPPDAMPDSARNFILPVAAGEYQVEARDLVGNRSYRDFDVSALQQSSVAGASLPSVRFFAAREDPFPASGAPRLGE